MKATFSLESGQCNDVYIEAMKFTVGNACEQPSASSSNKGSTDVWSNLSILLAYEVLKEWIRNYSNLRIFLLVLMSTLLKKHVKQTYHAWFTLSSLVSALIPYFMVNLADASKNWALREQMIAQHQAWYSVQTPGWLYVSWIADFQNAPWKSWGSPANSNSIRFAKLGSLRIAEYHVKINGITCTPHRIWVNWKKVSD